MGFENSNVFSSQDIEGEAELVLPRFDDGNKERQRTEVEADKAKEKIERECTQSKIAKIKKSLETELKEKETINLRNGKKLKVTSKEILSDGRFSEEVAILKVEDDRGVCSSIVRKVFKNPIDAQKSVEQYQLIKESGFPTFDFYELTEEGNAIVMTNGNRNGRSLIAANNRCPAGDAILENGGLNDISNFDTFLKGAFDIVSSATERGIYIHGDAYLFSVADNSQSSDLKPLIGDFDFVAKKETIGETELNFMDKMKIKWNLKKQNLKALRDNLADEDMFLDKYVAEPKRTKYINLVNQNYSEYLNTK